MANRLRILGLGGVALLILLLTPSSALATKISVQSQTLTGIFFPGVSASQPPHIRIYYSKTITENVNHAIILGGAPNGQGASNVYLDITTTWSAGTVTVPGFTLDSTDDALDDRTATVSFFWYGAQNNFIGAVQGMNSLVIYAHQASTIGCSPASTCGFWVDLRVSNQGHIIPGNPTATYSTVEIDRKIAAVLVSATGLPDPGSNGILSRTGPNVVTPRSLVAGSANVLVTNGNGVSGNPTIDLATNVVISASLPLSISGAGNISGVTASGSQAGFLSAADWTTFNNKQAALGFTAENVANKNATGGYAGLSSGKVANAQLSEVLSVVDLTDYTGASGTGTTAIKATITGPTNGQALTWDSATSNWINGTPSGGTVTSFSAGALSPLFTTSVATATTTPALSFTLSNQSANVGLFGPTTGAAAPPTFRAMVVADLPVADVPHGGSGLASLTAYALLAGGITATGNLQQVSGVGLVNQVLTSNGAGSLPTWQTPTTIHNLLAGAPTVPDTTAASPVRGDVITAQGGGGASWARLALGATGLALVSNGTDAVYGQVSLTAGVSGVLPIANGGTNATAVNLTTNGSAYYDGARLLTTAAGGAGTLCLTAVDGGAPAWGSCAGSAATAWSALSSPGANLTLAMLTFRTVFTYGTRADANDNFTIQSTTGNTGTGHLVSVSTIGTDVMKPLMVSAKGTSNGIEMDNTGNLVPIGTGKISPRAADIVGSIAYSQLTLTGAILNADLAGSIAYSKLSLTGAILNADLAGSIAYSKLNLTGAILNADLAGSIADTKLNTISTAGKVSDSALSSNIPLLNGANVFAPTARSSGSASYFTLNIPADTGITASTESIGFKTVTATRTWNTTVPTTQRENVFAAPTYQSSAGPTTMTTGVTVDITGAPIADTNVVITNPYALRVASGNALFAGVIKAGTTPTTLTDSAGKILSAALNTVAAAQGGTGLDTSGSTGIPLLAAGTWSIIATTGTGNAVRATSPSLTTPSFSSIVNTGTLTLPTSTDTLVGRATTDTFTNKTYDAEGTGNVAKRPSVVYLPAAGCNNATASANWDLPTANAPTANCLTGTNAQQGTLDFDDASNKTAQFEFTLPQSWTGNIDADIFWLVTTGGGSNAAKWTVATACSASAATYDTAFNAAQTITTNVGSNNNVTVSTQTSLTTTGCSAGNLLHLKVGRDTTDTSTATIRMLGARITLRSTSN